MTVLYVAGSGRSGSTLLARILGEADGFFAAGELRYVWQRGLVEDRLCGCGARFGDCPFWRRVVDHAGLGQAAEATGAEVAAGLREATRLRRLPRMAVHAGQPHRLVDGASGQLERVARLYAAVREVSGCRVVVDSSKLPTYGCLLRAVPGIDLRVVHLVRDPRAAAYSWARVKPQPDGTAFMQRQPALKSSLLWDVWNASAPRLTGSQAGHYTLVRYEDLVARPREVVGQLVGLAGHPGDAPAFFGERTVALGASHTVAGNPDRLRTGAVEIRADDEWRRRSTPWQMAVATLATAPLLGRFGYPLRPATPR